MVISSVVPLGGWGSAELGRENDQRLVQQPALAQVLQQRVSELQESRDAGTESAAMELRRIELARASALRALHQLRPRQDRIERPIDVVVGPPHLHASEDARRD